MRMTWLTGWILIGLTGVAWAGGEKKLSTGADFLKIDAGARGAALGQSYTALADDSNALHWNVAGLGMVKQFEAGYQRIVYLDGMSHNYAAFGLPLKGGDGMKSGLGLGFISFGVPAFDSTGGLEPEVSAQDMAVLFGVAFSRRNVSVGFSGKYILRDIAGEKARTFAGDAGVMGRPAPFFRFGLTVCNLGAGVRFHEEQDPLPTLARAGLAFTILENLSHRVLVSTDHTLQFIGSTYRGGAGLEYQYSQLFSVRGGYYGDHDRRDYSAGVGLDMDVFRIDYAYLPFGDLGDTHRISALFRFGKADEANRGLRAPSRLTAEAYDRSALVTWREVYTRDVTGYHLYIRKPGQEKYRRLTKDPLTVRSVKLRKLHNGTDYEVGVTSVTAAGRESRMARVHVLPDPQRSLQRLDLVPINLKAELRGEGVVLTWEPSATAAGYHLYLLTEQGTVDRRLNAAMLANPEVTLRKLVPDKTYRFHVTAVGKDGTESDPSASVETRLTSSTVAAQAPTPTPAPSPAVAAPPGSLTVLPGSGKATLIWSPVPGSAGYVVYVSTDGGQTYRRLTPDPLKETRAVLKPLRPKTYHFAVTSLDPAGTESPKALSAPVVPLAEEASTVPTAVMTTAPSSSPTVVPATTPGSGN